MQVMDGPRLDGSRREASGLVRTLVVASATLAILLVCFSIYQYSQLEPEPAKRIEPRLPSPPEAPGRDPDIDVADGPGVQVGDAKIGRGRDITLTIYMREGTRARLKIAVRDYTPVQGSSNEFRLVDPEIRMRTSDGRAVHVIASEGFLEAQRKSGGGLEPRRGRLTGGVVIDIDRLTEQERAELAQPGSDPDAVDPAQFVRVEVETIEFDLDYAKILVPRGPLHLSASDIDFKAEDLEVRFNEDEGRVEYLRINRGGRIELRDLGGQLGLSIPSTEAQSETRATLVNWLRSTLQATLEAQATPEPPKPEPAAVATVTEDGIPVFQPDTGDEEDLPKPAVRYFAHIEGNVDARQLNGEVVQARLQSDILEILRAFTEDDKEQVRSKSSTPPPGDAVQPALPRETLVLQWGGRLVLEAVSPDHARWTEDESTKITASGSPATVSSPKWNATCVTLEFSPDESHVWLNGTEETPVVVQSADQGSLSGVQVYTERSEDELFVRVTGPGTMDRSASDEPGGILSEDPAAQVAPAIEFADRLEVRGRFVTRSWPTFSGGIASREFRVFDTATFFGGVKLRAADTDLAADKVTAHFGEPPSRRSDQQSIERLEGRGNVVMSQGRDNVSCQEIDIALSTDRTGKVTPLTATARGNVEAAQGERVIEAGETLTVDFEMVSRSPARFDPAKAYAAAKAAGLDPTKIDWEARRRAYEATLRTEVAVKRLRAAGAVSIVDPRQGMDVKAEKVDCSIVDGREIETALVSGHEGHPASVRLNDFSVTGNEIRLDVPDEWAQVPGAGRMTLRTHRDLDGHQTDHPTNISITWDERMKYQGRENRAVFSGNVHAVSASTTTFDSSELLIEFDDKAQNDPKDGSKEDWWIFQDLADRLKHGGDSNGSAGVPRTRFSKEPAYILATGQVTVETAELDETTGKPRSRAHLSGPRLSVNLRPEVSKMLIEGAGRLFLQDLRPASDASESAKPDAEGLFSIDGKAGPSATVIKWDESMWYDFSINQTRFEGDVDLKHFSGAALSRALGQSVVSEDAAAGRSTFLKCGLLTVDFLGRSSGARPAKRQRMGGLSSDQLRQFQASRSVTLQDQTAYLPEVTADRIVYERDRNILSIFGAPGREARIVRQKPGEAPSISKVQRAFYDLENNRLEAQGGSHQGR